MAPEAGDEESHRPPPHPLDRVWMHPSELGAAEVPRSSRAPRLPVVLTAAFAGAMLATGILVFGGFLLRDDDGRGASAGTDDVVAAADALASIVTVQALGPAGVTVGSGVSLGDGQVVTSARLLAPGATLTVTDLAGDTYPSNVLGHDEESNLALLDVGADLPPAPLGRAELLSDEAEVVAISAMQGSGHWIHPATLADRDTLVTTEGGEIFAGLLTTDAPTGLPHVGGALVNGDGTVVGILVSPPGTSATGVAVPIEKATGVCDQLRRDGTADHGWLGVAGVDGRPGVEIRRVIDGSPAAEAGIEAGDRIVALGEQPLDGVGALAAAIRARRPGDDVDLVVEHDGTPRAVTITLGTFQDSSHKTP